MLVVQRPEHDVVGDDLEPWFALNEYFVRSHADEDGLALRSRLER
jgi:hypothetical protein